MPAKPPAGPGKEMAKETGKETGAATGRAKLCPICGKPAREASLPFCSGRCRDVDLNRWLSNSYVVPGKDDDEDAE
jgi:endogenous inhibitor of DNA gyrase (YacG/DUF329 family)